MKKLMTMIAAVATAFGLFAAVPSITDNAVDFSKFANMNPWDLTDKDKAADALWTYTDETPAKDEAQIADGELVLATGAKILTRKFASTAVTVNDELGLFANVKLDFQNQGIDVDSIPTATDLTGAKLALFLLDTSDVEGSAVDEGGTNLFAIAGCGATRALYQLSATVDDAFLAQEHSFTIKFYNQALSVSNRAGFMIYMDGEKAGAGEGVALKALYRYDLDGDVFDLTERTACDKADFNYLGDLTVNPSLMNWYKQQRLLVSLMQDEDQTFAGVEFKGKASIASVKLTDDKADFPFIPGDAKAIGVVDTALATKLTASNFEFDPTDGASYADGEITVFDDATQITVTPTFSLDKEIHEITIGSKKGTDSLTFTINDGTILTVREAVAAAYVDGEPCETFKDALKKAQGKSGATLKLNANLVKADLTQGVIESGKDMVLDLAGKTITSDGNDGIGVIFVAGGALTITNSTTEVGAIIAEADNGIAVNNDGDASTVTIVGGKFDGLVQNFYEEVAPDPMTYTGIKASAGTFSFDPTYKFLADGYMAVDNKDGTWTVVEAPKTITVTVGAAKENSTVEVISNGLDSVTAKLDWAESYTLPADGSNLKVTYTADDGYEFAEKARIVEFTLATDGAAATAPTPTEITYNITFTSQDGTTAPADMTYTVNTKFPLALNDATTDLESIEFKGWTNETYTSAIKAIPERPATLGDIALVAQWDAVTSPEQQAKDANVSGLDEITDETEKKKANENFTSLFIALGSDPANVATWTKNVYGDGNKIPAAKLAVSDANLIAAAAAYNLKVMASPVTITPEAATDGGFTFTLKDGGNDNPVVMATAAQQLIKYSASLENGGSFAPSTAETVTAEISENLKISAKFTYKDELGEDASAGFMKVDLSVAE